MMQDLPEEIWLQIFFRVHSGFGPLTAEWQRSVDVLSLSKICRVSKRFHRIAQPLLYRNLPADPLLIRTACERPDLALLARSLDVSGHEWSDEAMEVLGDSFRVSQGALMLPLELKSSIMRGLKEATEDSRVALALTLFPNLEWLGITVPHEQSLVRRVFAAVTELLTNQSQQPGGDTGSAQAPKMTGHFSRLKEIHMRHWDTENFVDAWNMAEIFELTALETLYGFATGWEGPMPSEMRGKALGIMDVDLDDSIIDHEAIESLLTLCPLLHSLRVCWGTATVGDCEIDFAAMGAAFRQHGANLEILVLDPREAFAYQEGMTTGHIGSLRELQKLQQLRITRDILCGIVENDDDADDSSAVMGFAVSPLKLEQVLPKSLEVLHLYPHFSSRWADEQVSKEMNSLIASGLHPNLRQIEFGMQNYL
ncbi:hypothetical protein BJ170DRAFT_607496 [Xylariales sp. AK1849]|nr:hypothetical protein BJ170DRAFT_607496 [Xylariales sp. AK1849]